MGDRDVGGLEGRHLHRRRRHGTSQETLLESREGLIVGSQERSVAIDRVAFGRVHLLTLVRQREVGRHVPDFASGLRDALREDPDILLVGEMRDAASIQLALTAAETGHLVLASLHSRTAPSAVERIVDAYPPERQRQIRVQLADYLVDVQRHAEAVRILAPLQRLLPDDEAIAAKTAAATEALEASRAKVRRPGTGYKSVLPRQEK